MPDVPIGVKDNHAVTPEHADHDAVLVARYAGGDAYPGEEALGRTLVERCAECARAAADIRLLSAALAASQAPARARDFRLTAEQAERLRGNAFERALRRLVAPGLAPLRPLAGVALSIGLLMFVVGAALPAPTVPANEGTSFGAGAPADVRASDQPREQAPEVPVAAPGQEFQPQTDHGQGPRDGRTTSTPLLAEDAQPPLQQVDADEQGVAADLRGILVWLGLSLAAVSLGTLLLVIVARRRLQDPLLR
jgi:hypothetical protein